MLTAIYIVVAILVLGVIYVGIRQIGGAYLKWRGTRLVSCPETGAPAGVELKTGRAALSAVFGHPALRLKDCSRWPEHRACGQECLKQIESAPEECLIRSILARWYHGQSCVYCGKPLGEVYWLEHRPCVMNAELKTFEWKDIEPENIPDVLKTHRPVCWNCHVTETFRHEFPDLVVERNWKK
jgi:hypothetical protein